MLVLFVVFGTWLVVVVGILVNNSRVTQLKNLIRTECRVPEVNFRSLDEKIQRLENILLTTNK